MLSCGWGTKFSLKIRLLALPFWVLGLVAIVVATDAATGATSTAASVAGGASCMTPWGMPVMDGQFVTAYYENRPAPGRQCQSEIRMCSNGYLSGFYSYQDCIEDNGCQVFPWGYIPHMSSVIAYRNAFETGGRRCESEVRYCSYGHLSGWFSNQYCTAH